MSREAQLVRDVKYGKVQQSNESTIKPKQNTYIQQLFAIKKAEEQIINQAEAYLVH